MHTLFLANSMSLSRKETYSGFLKQTIRVRGGGGASGGYNGWSSSSEDGEDAISSVLGIKDPPLIKAVQEQSIDKVRQLLKATIKRRENNVAQKKRRVGSADIPLVEVKCGLGLTPLMYACQAATRPTAASVTIMHMLHQAGADPDAKNADDDTALMRCTEIGRDSLWSLE